MEKSLKLLQFKHDDLVGRRMDFLIKEALSEGFDPMPAILEELVVYFESSDVTEEYYHLAKVYDNLKAALLMYLDFVESCSGEKS